MEIPNTIFVALGAILAATLAGIFSFVSLINQKEGKISEFRQNWIDNIRDDLSKFTSSLDKISSSWQLIQIEETKKDTPFNDYKFLNKFHKLIENDLETFSVCYQRIFLRLNKEEHLELIDELKKAKATISSPKVMFKKEEINLLIDRIINISQKILKDEWKVVKAGELPYRRTKMATIIMIILLFASLIFSFGMYIKNSSYKPIEANTSDVKIHTTNKHK